MHIKKIASAGSASLSDSDDSMGVPRRKKAKNVILCYNKSPKGAHERHHGVKSYCVICKKSGIPECKYLLHSAEDSTGVRPKCPIKDSMGGTMGSRTNAVQNYKKSENKWKK